MRMKPSSEPEQMFFVRQFAVLKPYAFFLKQGQFLLCRQGTHFVCLLAKVLGGHTADLADIGVQYVAINTEQRQVPEEPGRDAKDYPLQEADGIAEVPLDKVNHYYVNWMSEWGEYR